MLKILKGRAFGKNRKEMRINKCLYILRIFLNELIYFIRKYILYNIVRWEVVQDVGGEMCTPG